MTTFYDALSGEIRELNLGATKADRLRKQEAKRERQSLLEAMRQWQQSNVAAPQGGAPHRPNPLVGGAAGSWWVPE